MKCLLIIIFMIPSAAHSWQQTYKFKFKDQNYSIKLEYDDAYISKCMDQVDNWNRSYGAYSEKYNSDISKYIEDAPCKRVVKDVHAKLETQYKALVSPQRWDDINFRIAFVGSIQYTDDSETHQKLEFFQTPFETLYSLKGDCEDTAFLLSMLFSLQGYNSILIQLPEHQAVCIDPFSLIWNGKSEEDVRLMESYDFISYFDTDYYFCESTKAKDGNCYVMGKRPDFTAGKVQLIEFVGSYNERQDDEGISEMMELKKQMRQNGGIPLLIGNR